MGSDNERLIQKLKDKIEDIYDEKVSPFIDMSTQRKTAEIQKKIKTEQEAQLEAQNNGKCR